MIKFVPYYFRYQVNFIALYILFNIVIEHQLKVLFSYLALNFFDSKEIY